MSEKTYRTQKTQGKRHRAAVKLTLAADVVVSLRVLSRAMGLPRSRVVDAAVRALREAQR